MVKNGYVVEGMSILRSGSTALRATGAEAGTPNNIALLAEAYEISGQIEEAWTLLDQALQAAKRTGERLYEAELYRHKGRLLLSRGKFDDAEKLYRKALSIARLRRDQDRRTEAFDLLASIYGWFIEGFDTPDLKEAKAPLEELG